ncbi:hypothetical protein [Arthrobacter sp. JUb115]|uniref:hypothetical protein n=1 Tax=Arthrobacter sp. JUb115 TaxID=2485108 RepID=UPI00105F235B|nr:hypothetical protein [Arthrobacter sp. JUb115]TDU27071.1 hypothetical protein EDF61_104147 [Arthrobacter sp. JUb115]
MPFTQVSDAPANGGASTLRSHGPHLRFLAMAQHPSTSPAPRVVDRERMYQGFDWKDPDSLQWPRSSVRASPGLAAGELVWGAKIWEAPGVPARDAHGLLIAFSGEDREKVIADAQKRVRELRWSKLGRLRLQEPRKAPEKPCQ